MTGLSLLAFLGAGYTHLSRDTYDGVCFGTVVKKGLQWMMAHQGTDGCIGDPKGPYVLFNHALMAAALSEAYGLTSSSVFKQNAQKSIDYLLSTQNAGGGWGQSPGSGDNDPFVTAWCVMALVSARASGLAVPDVDFDRARARLNAVAAEIDSGKARGFVLPGIDKTATEGDVLTAVVMMSRTFTEKDRSDPWFNRSAKRLLGRLPDWDPAGIDFNRWYFASLALFRYDGPQGFFWKGWNERLKQALVMNEKRQDDGCANGSWDPIGPWGGQGGRVWATAINTLTMEVYYRYASAFGLR